MNASLHHTQLRLLTHSLSGLACLVVGTANVLFALSILRYKALRRKNEYLIMMSLAVADAIHMLNGVSNAVYNLYLTNGEPRTVGFCLKMPHIFLDSFSNHLCSLVLLLMALDRLLVVALPTKYFSWTKLYAWRMMTAAYSCTLLLGVFGLGLASVHAPDRQGRQCRRGDVLANGSRVGVVYAFYHAHIPLTYALISILLYFYMALAYRKRQNKTGPTGSGTDQQTLRRERQRRLNKSIGISCISFLLFMGAASLSHEVGKLGFSHVALGLQLFSYLNALSNMCIYQVRHREMQLALKGLLTGKDMPANLKLWQPNATLKAVLRLSIRPGVMLFPKARENAALA